MSQSDKNKQVYDSFLIWLRASHTPSTVLSYNFGLRWFFRWLGEKDLHACTVNDFSGFLVFLENKGFKSGTRNHYATCVRALWRWLRRQGLVSMDETLIPLPNKVDVESYPCLEADVFNRILDSFDEDFPKDLRDKTIVRFLFLTGVRQGELRAIKLSDLKLEDKSCHVKTFKRKNHYRDVFFDTETLRLLNKWLSIRDRILDRQGMASPWLFLNLSSNSFGSQLAKHAIIRIFTSTRTKLKIKEKISAHSARHGHATFAARMGMDIWKLKDSLGHANLKSTQVYVHMSSKDVQNEHGRVFSELTPSPRVSNS